MFSLSSGQFRRLPLCARSSRVPGLGGILPPLLESPPTFLRGASCLTAKELGAALADRAELLFHRPLLPVKPLGFLPSHPQP